ncbi:Uncharacterised protein [uncultured archaeon]|nr:Uncharacterised protein [uncultured archaeon]
MSLVNGVETLLEGFQQLDRRLMHAVCDLSDDMLRCNLQVAGDVVLAELFKVVGSIGQNQIVPYPGAHIDLSNSWYGSQPAQKLHLTAVVSVQAGTVGGAELIPACTLLPSSTSHTVHVSRRPTHILDYSFEAWHSGEPCRLPDYGLWAAALDNPSLVVGQSAEGA